MIAAVRGRLEEMGADNVVIEVGGLSLRLYVPTTVLNDLGEIGSEVKLYTHFYVREAQMSLYGFKSQEQLSLFELLLGVAGVGPRAALNVLSHADSAAVQLAIAQSDADFFKKVPGIGAKTASRIILELKGKLVEVSSPARVAALAGSEPGAKNSQAALERMQLIEALSNLGYTTPEIQSALGSIPADPPLTLEQQVLTALRYLGQ
jgi:holliday junction DNA helicase RuvA